MLTNMEEILLKAKENKTAIPQFNINNLEWTKYILEVCEEEKNPVILGVSEGVVKYLGGYNTIVNLVVGLMIDLNITIPVVLHLDHGSSFEACQKAIDSGFTSVMIDYSAYSLDENISMTSKVVDYAQKYKVSVEGEYGNIKRDSEEKSLSIETEDCAIYASSTGITALAPYVGNAHGIYKEEPKLEFEKIIDISKTLNIPLVLHGGSGIPDADITKAIECGITKLNINTDLQLEWANSLKAYIKENHAVYDPRKIIGSGEEAIKERVRKIITLINKNR